MKISKTVYHCSGGILYEEPMIFKRLWAVGQDLIHNYKSYLVKNVEVIDDVQHVHLEDVLEEMKKEYAVRLDVLRIPHGNNQKHVMVIAERLLNICGLTKVWDSPEHGHRLFYVRSIPQDIPQAGIYWIEEEILYGPNNPFEGGDTKL